MTDTRPRFPHLDAMRALAATGVLLFHAGITTGFSSASAAGAVTARLDVGVTVFFLLSGFLLYRPYAAARVGGTPVPSLGRFYRRRLLRIVPAYWLALTALAIEPGLDGHVLSFPGGLRFYLFAQNLSHRAVLQGIGPAWTLGVELSFYAVLPLYAAGVARRLGGRPARAQARTELLLLATLGVLSVAFRAVQFSELNTGRGLVLPYLLPSFGLWFALGMALAVLSVTGAAPGLQAWVQRHPGRCWLAGGALLAVAALGLGLPRSFTDGYTAGTWASEHVIYAAIALCLLAPATLGVDGGGSVRRVLAWRPLAGAGLVSYGVYLYHVPLLAELHAQGWAERATPFAPTLGLTLAGLALAVTCATVSYVVLERPLLQRGAGRRRAVSAGTPGRARDDRAG